MDQDDRRVRGGAIAQDERYSEIAGKLVRLAWRDVEPPRHTEVSPGVVDAVATELRSRGRRRRFHRALRWTGGACAGAAALIGVLALVSSHGRQLLGSFARVSASGESSSRDGSNGSGSGRASRLLLVLEETNEAGRLVLPNRFVGAGDTFRAGIKDTVRIGSAAGTELVVEAGGSLRVVEADAMKRFALLRGAVHLRVAKLLPGERFIVETSDTKVEVHGTQFRVSLVDAAPGCEGAVVTRVSVSEGVVSVDSSGLEARLFPGDDWSSKCAEPPVAQQDRPRSRRKLARRRSHPMVRPVLATANAAKPPAVAGDRLYTGGSKSLAAAPSASQLAAQNDLFASAVRARRNGRAEDALARFERFVRQYPDSSLIESALVHRMRLLARSDHRAAVDAAAGYLARFPDGFARGEAQLLLNVPAKP